VLQLFIVTKAALVQRPYSQVADSGRSTVLSTVADGRPPIADSRAAAQQLRSFQTSRGPPRSPNHFIGLQEDRLRDHDPERLCGFQAHHKFEFGWLLDRQISRVRAPENLVDVPCRSAHVVLYVRPVGYQPASVNIFPLPVHAWQPGLQRQIHKRRSMIEEEGVIDYSKYKACTCARLMAANDGLNSSGVRALTKLSSIASEGAAALRSSITFA
jgi:hypothetical protein